MKNLNIKNISLLFAFCLCAFSLSAQQIFTPSGAVNGTTGGGVGVGTTAPEAALGIRPGGTLPYPGLIVEASDANTANGYKLIISGNATPNTSNMARHVQIGTGDKDSRLTLKCAAEDDFAPRFQMISPEDVGNASLGWAIFDYGSRNVDLPDASFKVRHMPKIGAPVDMLHAEGPDALYLAPTQGLVGIGTVNPEAKLHVNGTIRSTDLVSTGLRNVGATSDGNLVLFDLQMDDIADVDLTGLTANSILVFNGGNWVVAPAPSLTGNPSQMREAGSNNEVEVLKEENATLKAQVADMQAEIEAIKEQLSGLGVELKTTESVEGVQLFQNQPNPFHEVTSIRYELPRGVRSAALHIRDAKGNLLDAYRLKGVGHGIVRVEGGQLAAGTYTYSIVVDGNVIDTKRMVLTK